MKQGFETTFHAMDTRCSQKSVIGTNVKQIWPWICHSEWWLDKSEPNKKLLPKYKTVMIWCWWISWYPESVKTHLQKNPSDSFMLRSKALWCADPVKQSHQSDVVCDDLFLFEEPRYAGVVGLSKCWVFGAVTFLRFISLVPWTVQWYNVYKNGACNIWEQVQEVKLGSSTFGDVHLFWFLHSDSKLLLTNTDIDSIEDSSRGVSQIWRNLS